MNKDIVEIPVEGGGEQPRIKQKFRSERILGFQTKNRVFVRVEIIRGETDGTRLISIKRPKKTFALPYEDGAKLVEALTMLLEKEDLDEEGIEE